MNNIIQKFPVLRPGIKIKKNYNDIFEVDSKELRWWFAIPIIGEKTYWTIYDQPEWRLTEISEMNSICEAQIHNVDCVKIVENDWSTSKGWEYNTWALYGKITDKTVQWIATSHLEKGKKILKTFLDEDFNENWSSNKRHIKNENTLKKIRDDVFEFKGNILDVTTEGFYDVYIGDKIFTCMKVLESPKIENNGYLIEAYINKEGRTVLFRRYNGEKWDVNHYWKSWGKKLPESKKIIINGVTFIHWYDCTSDITLI